MPLKITQEIRARIELTAQQLVENLKRRPPVDEEFAFEGEIFHVSGASAEEDDYSAILEFFIEKITKEIKENECCVDDLKHLPGTVLDSEQKLRLAGAYASWTPQRSPHLRKDR